MNGNRIVRIRCLIALTLACLCLASCSGEVPPAETETGDGVTPSGKVETTPSSSAGAVINTSASDTPPALPADPIAELGPARLITLFKEYGEASGTAPFILELLMNESYYNSSFSEIADLTETKQRELFALFCAQLAESGYREFEHMIFNLYSLYTPYNREEYTAALGALSSVYRDTVLADRAYLQVLSPRNNWSFYLLLDEDTATDIESALSDDSLKLDSGELGLREYVYCSIFVNLPGIETTGTRGIPVMMNEQGEKLLYYSTSTLNKAHIAARELCDRLVSMVEEFTGWRYTTLSEITDIETAHLFVGGKLIAEAKDVERLEEILRLAESSNTPQCVEYTYNGTYLVLTYDSGKIMLIELNYDHDLLWLYPHFHYDYGPEIDDEDGRAEMLALFGLDHWPRGE